MRTLIFSLLLIIAFSHSSPMIKRLHVDFYKLLNKYGDQSDDSPVPYSGQKGDDSQWIGSGWNQMSLNAFHSL